MSLSASSQPEYEIANILTIPDGFTVDEAARMLWSINPYPLAVLGDLCKTYDETSLRSIGVVLANEYEDSQYKARVDTAEAVTFTIIAAPLLGHPAMIKAISTNGKAIRKIIPSMLTARYRDDAFSDWFSEEAFKHHVNMTRGTFLKSVIFAPYYDADIDVQWLGKNYRMVLSVLDELIARQNADPELILLLNGDRSSALQEGLL